jgi:hypothetical protein
LFRLKSQRQRELQAQQQLLERVVELQAQRQQAQQQLLVRQVVE